MHQTAVDVKANTRGIDQDLGTEEGEKRGGKKILSKFSQDNVLCITIIIIIEFESKPNPFPFVVLISVYSVRAAAF